MKRRRFAALSVLCAVLFIVMLILVRTADVAAIGPEGTEIGLSHINGAFAKFIGVRPAFKTFTDLLGYVATAVGAVFAVTGLVQLIKRKSFAKVDREILALGGLFALVIIFYLVFEVVVINYRPVILPGEEHVEASFPSSHTMLAIVVFGGVEGIVGKYIKSDSISSVVRALCIIIMVAAVAGRLLSGAHWLSDIAAGCFLSGVILFAFYAVIASPRHKPKH